MGFYLDNHLSVVFCCARAVTISVRIVGSRLFLEHLNKSVQIDVVVLLLCIFLGQVLAICLISGLILFPRALLVLGLREIFLDLVVTLFVLVAGGITFIGRLVAGWVFALFLLFLERGL